MADENVRDVVEHVISKEITRVQEDIKDIISTCKTRTDTYSQFATDVRLLGVQVENMFEVLLNQIKDVSTILKDTTSILYGKIDILVNKYKVKLHNITPSQFYFEVDINEYYKKYYP